MRMKVENLSCTDKEKKVRFYNDCVGKPSKFWTLPDCVGKKHAVVVERKQNSATCPYLNQVEFNLCHIHQVLFCIPCHFIHTVHAPFYLQEDLANSYFSRLSVVLHFPPGNKNSHIPLCTVLIRFQTTDHLHIFGTGSCNMNRLPRYAFET